VFNLVASLTYQLQITLHVIVSVVVFMVYQEVSILLMPFPAVCAEPFLFSIKVIQEPRPILLRMAASLVSPTRPDPCITPALLGTLVALLAVLY
jgi:hypothetical protein